MANRKVTILDLQEWKEKGQPVTMLAAYDYPTARLVDQAGIDVILVGDSVGMVLLGYEHTVPVTMDEMLHYCKAVARAAKRALLVGDMPFLSYQVDAKEAIRNAGRFLKEGDMDVIKIEGGRQIAPTAKAIVDAGIPVMGHIGLTPQTISKLGGYRVQGRDVATAKSLIDDATALEEAGVFSLLLEAIPSPVAKLISKRVSIPTIGIGSGPDCDGQSLVIHDLAGLIERTLPRFVKQYVNVLPTIQQALSTYREEVTTGAFPGPEHCYGMSDEALQALLKELGERNEDTG